MTVRQSACISLLFVATACGGQAPEPSVPEGSKGPEEPAGEEDPADAESSSDDMGADQSEDLSEPEAPASTEPTGPSGRTPKEMLTVESTRFVLSFSSSDPGLKAQERCDSQHSNDPQKRNECMKAARSTVKEDVMQFVEGQGRWVWTVSTQRGNTLTPLKKTNFTWGEETKNSVEIQPSKGPKVLIGVPNNYSITIEDAQHGKLTYDAKISE